MDQVVYFTSNPTLTTARSAENALAHAAQQLSPLMARGVRFHAENSVPRLLSMLRSHDVDALVIDARQESGPVHASPSLDLMTGLFTEGDIRSPIGREQTWLVVPPDERGTELSFHAGTFRLAGTLALDPTDHAWRVIWQNLDATLRRRKGGRVALCLAGGGFEGLFFELGVLRALQHFLPEYALQDVDILCGISAGSVIGAFLANGLPTSDILRGMLLGEGPLDRIERSDVFDANFAELASRLGLSARSILRGRSTPLQSLFRLAPTGLFAGKRLRAYLETQLNKPGLTDDFRKLRRMLFIGATDQDTAEHIIFGGPGWDHVPIHRAVRASTALTPFFAPEQIDNRYFVDGAFTRTTNVRIAVENGASLVILVDPLVPIYSEQSGYVFDKGGIMVGMQGLKSLIHGRFDRAVHMLRAMYPHVAFHLFQPDGATMRVMAGSPSKLFHRPEVEEIAFRETLRSIRQGRFDSLQRDFARHSIAFADPQTDLGAVKRDLLDEAAEVQVA
jgi:predicted acylesterase/phospholipase RssA